VCVVQISLLDHGAKRTPRNDFCVGRVPSSGYAKVSVTGSVSPAHTAFGARDAPTVPTTRITAVKKTTSLSVTNAHPKAGAWAGVFGVRFLVFSVQVKSQNVTKPIVHGQKIIVEGGWCLPRTRRSGRGTRLWCWGGCSVLFVFVFER
jgi:hypothetical protein